MDAFLVGAIDDTSRAGFDGKVMDEPGISVLVGSGFPRSAFVDLQFTLPVAGQKLALDGSDPHRAVPGSFSVDHGQLASADGCRQADRRMDVSGIVGAGHALFS